jgi:Spy/CpxP family protein refolding chaperone
MRRTCSHFLLAAAVVGVTVASSVEAQRPVRPREPAAGVPGPLAGVKAGQGVPGGPDARRGRGGPRGNAAAVLLRRRELLQLTDDQVKRLEALAAAGTPKDNASDMLRARADLMDALQGDGNLASARTALDRMSRLRNDRMIAGLKQWQEARAVLTAEQKRTLDNLRQGARQRFLRGGRRALGRRGLDGAPGLRRGPGLPPQGPMGPQGPGGRRGMRGGEGEG